MVNSKIKVNILLCLGVSLLLVTGCEKIPPEVDYLSNNASFDLQDAYYPVLGRTILESTGFNADGSTYPLHFEIMNVRRASDGSPAPELTEKRKVKVWQRDYTGREKSIEEIEAKRVWVEKPYLDIREGSGDFIFWNTPYEGIRTYPDSGYLFDVQVSNNGGEKMYEDFRLKPVKEIPYEPYEYDERTGERLTEDREHKDGRPYKVPLTLHPSFMKDLYFDKDSLMIDTMISIYFIKEQSFKGEENSLTFKFMDEDLNPIPPDSFSALSNNDLNPMAWDSLVHGFDMKMTDEAVTYTVSYPIPLTSLATNYTSGSQAQVAFGYSRRGFGGQRLNANFGLNFAIYQPGAWTILFYFRRNPIFTDD